MNGNDVINALKRKLRVRTDQNLSDRVGIAMPTIQVWKNRRTVTARQVAEIVHRGILAGAKNLQRNAIRPIVEFFPLAKVPSSHGKKLELFAIKSEDGTEHPYLAGLRKELESHQGVYVFFDSRGQAIYAGKTEKQRLWREMKDAFNRSRGDLQRIRRVKHPGRKQKYQNSNEKARQITDELVQLHDLAVYFSAYQVADTMIEDVEAILVRCAANDLLNKRMEQFSRQRHS